MINSRGVVLLDSDRMLRQLVGLERRDLADSAGTRLITCGVVTTTSLTLKGYLVLSSRHPFVSAEQRAEQTRKIEAAMSPVCAIVRVRY